MSTNSEEVFKELNIQRTMFINNGFLGYISKILGITQNTETLEYGIVMPFVKLGDMRKYLSTNFHSMSWEDKLLIAGDMASGLSQLHFAGMAHRDLHSGNILQLEKEEVIICDLKLCQPVNHEATTTTRKDTKEKKIYGVIPYIPPEVLRGEKFTTAGDIYSFSMLLWELATGKPPFYDFSHDHILIMVILNGQRPKITSPLIPPCIAEIIVKCWDADPKNRLTADEVANKLLNMYKWVVKDTDEVSKIEEFKTVDFQFRESDKYVKEMAESDDSTTTNQSKTRTTTRINPGAVYTSRVLTLQMIDFTKG
ncbi:hypothetical protein G9A89_017557 [Geosiphon pyriformis]|nr:hypothetical protein G9A89_017557 [Geosiphon pyriformis]